jgi:hypothetical protein
MFILISMVARVFGLKTEKVVHGYRCESGVDPASEITVNGAAIESAFMGVPELIRS